MRTIELLTLTDSLPVMIVLFHLDTEKKSLMTEQQ